MGTKKPIISVIVDHKLKELLEKKAREKKVSVSKIAAELIKNGLINEKNQDCIITSELIDKLPYLIWVKDENLRYMYVNKAVLNFLGFKDKEEILGKTDIEVLPEDLAKVCLYSDMATLNRSEQVTEIETLKKNGKTVILETTKIPIKNEKGKVVAILGTAMDVTEVVELRQAYEKNKQELENTLKKITELCDLDPITGVFNRNKFAELLNRKVEDIKRTNKICYVVLLDIYNFRYFNEIYGIDIGNDILKHIVNEIKDLLKSMNIKGEIAKIGEDEFGILVEGIVNIETFLKRIRQSLKDLYIKDKQGRRIRLPRIILVAYKVPPSEINTGEKILTQLEIELYNLKNSDEDIKILTVESISKENISENESTLYEAINKGKIITFVQGIYSTEDMEIKGYEVFFRVKRDGEVLTAEELLPTALTTGLILDIDKFILNTVQKHKSKFKMDVHVNLSSLTLYKCDIASNNIVDILINLRENTLFEVSELDFLNNLKTIKDLHKMYKLRFVIDKLGVKYCPIKLIVELYSERVVSMVKLDKNLIRNLTSDESSRKIVETIVNLSKNFGIRTVAVGVESEDIYKAVKSLSIDYCQGFFLEEPKEITEIV